MTQGLCCIGMSTTGCIRIKEIVGLSQPHGNCDPLDTALVPWCFALALTSLDGFEVRDNLCQFLCRESPYQALLVKQKLTVIREISQQTWILNQVEGANNNFEERSTKHKTLYSESVGEK